jgi:hypothetical protein
MAGRSYVLRAKAPIALIFAVYEKRARLEPGEAVFKTTIEFIEKLQIRLGFNENYEIGKSAIPTSLYKRKAYLFCDDKRGYLLEVHRALKFDGPIGEELIGQKMIIFISASDKSSSRPRDGNTEFRGGSCRAGTAAEDFRAQTGRLKEKRTAYRKSTPWLSSRKDETPPRFGVPRRADGAECWPYRRLSRTKTE